MYTKKLHFEAKNHLLLSDLQYDQYPTGRGRKRTKCSDFSYVFARDPSGIGRIAIRTKGGDSSPRNATFSYTSLRCGINIHILNCDRVLVLFSTFFRQKNPKLCCWLDFQLLMTERSDVYEITGKSCVKSPAVLRFAIRPIRIALRATTYRKCAFFERYRPRRNGYWSYLKSDSGRWFSASMSNFFVYITLVWHKYPYT